MDKKYIDLACELMDMILNNIEIVHQADDEMPDGNRRAFYVQSKINPFEIAEKIKNV